MTHENKLFNMSTLAWPIRTIIHDQAKVHYCAILFHFWHGCSLSSKRSSNNSILSPRLSADVIEIIIQFLSLNLYHSFVNNYFHNVFYRYELFIVISNIKLHITTNFIQPNCHTRTHSCNALSLQTLSTVLHSFVLHYQQSQVSSCTKFYSNKSKFYSLVYSFKLSIQNYTFINQFDTLLPSNSSHLAKCCVFS